MLDKIFNASMLVFCWCLWLQNFSLTKTANRLNRQNQELRKRLITVENYLFGTHTETPEIWGDEDGEEE